MQPLPLYHYAYFLFLNDNIVNIEKPGVIRSPTFVVDEFSGIFLDPSIFGID